MIDIIFVLFGLFGGIISGKLFYYWITDRIATKAMNQYMLVYDQNFYQFIWKKIDKIEDAHMIKKYSYKPIQEKMNKL